MGTSEQLVPTVDTEYLKMIQAVINRLAQNSFQTKSWSVAAVTAILAFASHSAQTANCALALFPAFCFWIMDAYYLKQERLFRALYSDAVRGELVLYSMDTSPYEMSVQSIEATMFATPVILIHAIIFVVIGIVIIVFVQA